MPAVKSQNAQALSLVLLTRHLSLSSSPRRTEGGEYPLRVLQRDCIECDALRQGCSSADTPITLNIKPDCAASNKPIYSLDAVDAQADHARLVPGSYQKVAH